MDDIVLLPMDTQGFEADGPPLLQGAEKGGTKQFYETAKSNPKQLLELVENMTMSSCNDAEEEAHLPEI